MGTHRQYMPRALRSTSQQMAHFSTLAALALTIVVAFSCISSQMSGIYYVQFLVGNQTLPVQANATNATSSTNSSSSSSPTRLNTTSSNHTSSSPASPKHHSHRIVPQKRQPGFITNLQTQLAEQEQTFHWVRVGVSGECVYSSTNDRAYCDRPSTGHAYYLTNPQDSNMPQNLDTVLRRSGKAVYSLYVAACVFLGITFICSVCLVLLQPLPSSANSRKSAVIARISRCSSVLAFATLLSATVLATSIYLRLRHLLNNYDTALDVAQATHRALDTSQFVLNPKLKQPDHFQAQLGNTAVILAWIGTAFSILGSLCWFWAYYPFPPRSVHENDPWATDSWHSRLSEKFSKSSTFL